MPATLVTVGKRMPDWVNTGVREYSKRLPPEFTLQILDVPSAKRGKSASTALVLAQEAEGIRAAIPKNSLTIVPRE